VHSDLCFSCQIATLVIGHLFLAAGLVMTGLVTAFPLILVTQVLWGSG
jgi:MFS transporter, DHA3 family, tetracycline resistance protein